MRDFKTVLLHSLLLEKETRAACLRRGAGTPAQQVFPGRAAHGGEKSSEATDQSAAGEDVTSANITPRHAKLVGGRAVEKRSGLFKGVVPSPNVCEA